MSLKLTRHQQTIYMLESTLMIAKVTPEYLSQQVQVVTLIPNQCLVYLGYVPVYVLIVTAGMCYIFVEKVMHIFIIQVTILTHF